jgi:GTP-binding protein YchF
MSIDIGIIGLPQSGKTTVFNALTGGSANTASRTAEGQAAHVGIAKVPEPRLDILNSVFHAKKIVQVETRYIDIGASVKNLVQDKGIGGELLNQLSNVDTLICVVRAFNDPSLPHPAGSIDIKRDIATMNLELIFSDLAIIERRREKIENSLKGAKPPERQSLLKEQEILTKFQAEMEKDRPIREMALEAQEAKIVTNYQLLTAKPLLVIINIGEEQLSQAAAMEEDINAQYTGGQRRAAAICGKLEMELAQMEPDEAREFRQDYGLQESGLERTIRLSHELSHLITFFTAGPNEVRAWSLPQGTPAVKAAGKIHSDMEKGFIRAESIGLDELVSCGGFAEARKQGKLRLEGKDYIIQEGDVITFLFNV